MEIEARLQLNNEEMHKPLVSVVMPVMNVEKFLDLAVASVLGQTLADFEFIIIDDASSDRTAELVREWQRRDKRIIFLENKEHQGITAAINNGLKIAQGRYLARMDGDDICLPERLAEQVKFLANNPDIALVGTFAYEINENSEQTGEIKKSIDPTAIAQKILYYSPCLHSSIMFRSALIKDIGWYNEAYPFCQDQDLYFRTIFSGYKIANIPLFLLKYRRHPASVARNRLMRAGISLKIKKAIIKKFKLQVSIRQYLFFYIYYIVEGWLPLRLRYGLEAMGRKILLKH